VLEQHPDSARPTIWTARKVGGLLIKYFAGSSVGNLNYNVVVGLGDPPHDAEERLVGASPQGDPGFAALAVPQPLGSDRLRIGLVRVNKDVAA